MLIDDIGESTALQSAEDQFSTPALEGGHASPAIPSGVGCESYVGGLPERMIRWERFSFEYVESCGTDRARGQRRCQGRGVNEAAARGVYNDCVRAHGRQRLTPEEMLCLICQRQV